MFNLKKIIFLASLISTLYASSSTFVTVPVADSLMYSADYYRWIYMPNVSTQDIYNNLSLSPESGADLSCHRYRQFLLGDRVTILNKTASEAHISSEIMRYDAETDRSSNDSWILKTNLASKALADLYQKIIDAPATSPWVLASPWYDDVHKITLSAGTRIICDATQSDDQTLSAFLLFSNPERIEQVSIPTSIAQPIVARSEDETRALFVSTLQAIATETEEGIVPLVWGGQSNIQRIKKDDRDIQLKVVPNMMITETAWYDYNMPQPLSGVDTPGLMLLAARIANIPLMYNNTATFFAQMPEATCYEDVKKGDLISAPGLIAAITSLDENKIVVARGYTAKTGCVIECELKDLFDNAQTIKDIFELNKAGKPLILKGKSYTTYKVLSLSSLIK